MAFEIWRDDNLLLEENYHLLKCKNITDPEIMQACFIRGYPINGTYDEMREYLTNHLLMIQHLHLELPPNTEKRYVQLFTLHLAALRQQFKS